MTNKCSGQLVAIQSSWLLLIHILRKAFQIFTALLTIKCVFPNMFPTPPKQVLLINIYSLM